MRAFAITALTALGLSLFASSSANAGGVYFRYGGGIHSGSYRYGGWTSPRRGHYDWHDTSHYDYIPGHVVPHGNHLHYIPGRFQFHPQGHFDYHRGRHHHHHH